MTTDVKKVGRMAEIMPAEVDELLEAAIEMRLVSRLQMPGWFYRYLIAHKAAHHVIRAIITRSHAS